MDEGMSDQVMLERMDGKLNVLGLQLDHMNKNMELANTRLNTHSDRITKLEQSIISDKGARDGASQVMKVLWAIFAVLFTGGFITIGTFIAFLAGVFKGA